MSGWQGSNRRERLPSNWAKIRAKVLKRDGGQCTHRDDYGKRCDEPATDVDHIRAGDDHSLSNLRALCSWHHNRKSGREGGTRGGAATARKRREIDSRFRRDEEHPGML